MTDELRGLDEWITGHYGEDQFDERPEKEDPEDKDDRKYHERIDREDD